MIETIVGNIQLVPLLLGLVLVLIAGFKLLQTFVETLLIGLISAFFYFGLVWLMNIPLSLEYLLIFIIVGSASYIGLKAILIAFKTTRLMAKPPKVVLGLIIRQLKKLFGIIKSRFERESSGRNDNVKETVIENVDDDQD